MILIPAAARDLDLDLSEPDAAVALFARMAPDMGATGKAGYLAWRDAIRAFLRDAEISQRASRARERALRTRGMSRASPEGRAKIRSLDAQREHIRSARMEARREIRDACALRRAGKLWSARHAEEAHRALDRAA